MTKGVVLPTEEELAEYGGFLVDALGARLTPTQREVSAFLDQFQDRTYALPGTYSNVFVGSPTPVTIDSIRQAMGRIKRAPTLQPVRAIVPPGFPQPVPAVPMGLLADGYELRTSRVLHGPYERERFSGGVNLSAQARNREIDARVYVVERLRVIYVSPRTLKHIKGLSVAG